jgi:hypothetical protein
MKKQIVYLALCGLFLASCGGVRTGGSSAGSSLAPASSAAPSTGGLEQRHRLEFVE